MPTLAHSWKGGLSVKERRELSFSQQAPSDFPPLRARFPMAPGHPPSAPSASSPHTPRRCCSAPEERGRGARRAPVSLSAPFPSVGRAQGKAAARGRGAESPGARGSPPPPSDRPCRARPPRGRERAAPQTPPRDQDLLPAPGGARGTLRPLCTRPDPRRQLCAPAGSTEAHSLFPSGSGSVSRQRPAFLSPRPRGPAPGLTDTPRPAGRHPTITAPKKVFPRR